MSNYFCVVSYLGAAYYGFERQKNHPTIQGKIEECLEAILHEKISINASGRTDAMVNAKGQTFSFRSSSSLLNDKSRFLYAMNRVLPGDISILSIREMNESFHARFSAKQKTYSYSLHIGEKDPFLCYEVAMLGERNFDFSLFQAACLLFLGKHCFQDFTPKSEDGFLFYREIYDVSFSSDDFAFRVNFTGDGFMRYQVRTMVGAAIKVALGKMTLNDLRERIDSKERRILSYKAPAEGLCLEKVFY